MTTTVHLYDTTLRDGMQGQGMSLSAAEKVRVVQALDRLGVQFVEAGFPSSNPKEEDGTSCNDANACTQTDTCQAGVCTGANPVVCSALDQCHAVGACDPVTFLHPCLL